MIIVRAVCELLPLSTYFYIGNSAASQAYGFWGSGPVSSKTVFPPLALSFVEGRAFVHVLRLRWARLRPNGGFAEGFTTNGCKLTHYLPILARA